LFVVTVEGRTPSDIKNWQVRADETEAVRPIPKPPPRSKPEPASVAAMPAVVVDPFLHAFHEQARDLLDLETYKALVELTGGAANA